jgi:ABC-type uncharacterized transport system involved in gliding motility auxiliary subunit
MNRQRRQFAGTIITLGLVAAALILCNLMAERFLLRWDLTVDNHFTLSPRSIQILNNLPSEIRVIGFYAREGKSPSPGRVAAEDRLSEMARHARGALRYDFVDPELQLSLARQYSVRSSRTLMFENTATARRASLPGDLTSEQDMIGAILAVTGAQQKKIYLLTGHQERDFLDFDADGPGMGLTSRSLMNENYELENLNLHERGTVPADAAAVIIAAPKRDLLADEETALQTWLAAGGRALVLLDPDPPQSIHRFLATWGIAVRPGVIVDTRNSAAGDPRTPLVERTQYAGGTEMTNGGAISAPLDVTFFPHATALDRIAGDKSPLVFTPLAHTSEASWTTTDPSRNTFEPQADSRGPHVLAMAVRRIDPFNPDAAPRAETADAGVRNPAIVVFGDADFASNRYAAAFSNTDFFLNAVNWLCQDYALIAMRPKPTAYRRLVVTAGELDVIRYSSWGLLPALLLTVSLVTWWRRR